ncbi:MAG: DUF6488 family protein [Trichloromonadaceae bacterium]
MRKIVLCLLTLFALTTATAFAGAGHSHGPVTAVSENQALEKATSVVQALVKKEKVDPSWSEVRPSAGEKKQAKVGSEWVVTFNNPKIEDKSKQTLYVFLNLGGEYLAANYTGK